MKQLIPFLFLLACSDAYTDAETAGTIEAYEDFLEKNPTHPKVWDAKMNLEGKYVEKAKESNTMADYDAYLDKYTDKKETKMYKEMDKARQRVAWTAVEDGKDLEGLKNYIKRYSVLKGDKTINKAKRILIIAEYGGLSMEKHIQERTSLSENAKGALDGWKWTTTFTNSGTKEIKELDIRIDYLDENGSVIDSTVQTAIGYGDFKHGREWLFNDKEALEKYPELGRTKPPMKRGDKRNFEYTTGNTPEDWAQKVTLSFERILFEK